MYICLLNFMVILNGIYTYNFGSECVINYGEIGIAMVLKTP